MDPNISNISLPKIPHDILKQIVDFGGAPGTMGALDKKKYADIVEVALAWFDNMNHEITRKLPLLEKNVKEKCESTNPLKIFMQTVNRLHDEAKLLGCDKEAPSQLTDLGRIDWECEHVDALVQNIAKKYVDENIQQIKAKDFKTFVGTVAWKMGVFVSLKEISETIKTKFENGTLILDPKVKLEDEHNHRVWENLLKNPKIHEIKGLTLHGISFLSPEIGQIVHLPYLQIETSRLKGLPHEIQRLENLKSLKIQGSDLEAFPLEIFKLKNLEKLVLRTSHLKTVPSQIKKLKNLKHLDLGDNHLVNIPFEMGELSKLEYLDLSTNQLTKFPNGLGMLTKLKTLILSENKLEDVSKIGQLVSLEVLYLSQNELKEFPAAFIYLNNLKRLELWENPLSVKDFPPEILKKKNLVIIKNFDELIQEYKKDDTKLKSLNNMFKI